MPTPAPVTLGRIERVFALIADLLPEVLDVPEAPAPARPSGSASILDQAPAPVAAPSASQVRVDLAHLVRRIGMEGLLADLAAILYDVSAEEAAEMTDEDLLDALHPFSLRVAGLTNVLADCARALRSR